MIDPIEYVNSLNMCCRATDIKNVPFMPNVLLKTSVTHPLVTFWYHLRLFFIIDWLVLGVQTRTEKQIHSDMSVGHGRLRFQVVKPFLPGNFIRIVPI